MFSKPRKDFTDGPIFFRITLFALPVMLTGILQILYGMADNIVVGRFSGDIYALGAVGSCGAIINLIVGLFMGLSLGAGVCVAHDVGAKHYDEVESVVHTAVLTSLVGSAIVTAIGLIFAPQLLAMMGIEASLIDQATLYMRAYFCGMPAMMLYNYCAAMLRSVGDTVRPLIFLSASGVVNVLLNLLMVIVFKTGALGVGVATAASQWVACALIIIFMLKTDGPCKIDLRKLRIDRKKLQKILAIGLPAGIQSSLFSISNVIIASAIHSFGSAAVVAGNTAAGNLDSYTYTVMNSIANSALTFTGQHVGAQKYDRLKKALLWHGILIFVSGLLVGGAMYIFGRPLIGVFAPNNEAVADIGMIRLAIIGLPYFLCGFMDLACYSLRGFGKSLAPTLISLIGSCVLRIVWIFAFFYPFFSDNIAMLYLSYPMTWFLTAVAGLICIVIEFKSNSKKSLKTENV